MSIHQASSTGPFRSQHSPRRGTHPYASSSTPHRRHQRSDSDSENMDPSQSSQETDRHYPQYNMSGDSSFGGGGRSPYNQFGIQGSFTRMPTLASIVNVDKIANDARLSSAHRQTLHTFKKLDTDDRTMMLYVHTLQNEAKLDTLLAALTDTNKTLSTLKVFMNTSWTLTESQEKLLKSLLRHYLIQPLSSYQDIPGHVQSYILKHVATLHLELYKTDPTVKAVINAFLSSQANNIKSGFRKSIWTAINKGTGLKSFARKIIESHHLPAIPDNPPNEILATLALMREVAEPLVAASKKSQPQQRGGDTGFWPNVETELEKLYTAHGNVRTSPAWLEWEKMIIAADAIRFKRGNAADEAHTRAEVDGALGVGDGGPSEGHSFLTSNEAPRTWNLEPIIAQSVAQNIDTSTSPVV